MNGKRSTLRSATRLERKSFLRELKFYLETNRE